MKQRVWVVLALVMIVPGLLFVTSCGKKKIASDPTGTESSGAEIGKKGTGTGAGEKGKEAGAGKMTEEELAKQRALEEQRRKEEEAKRKLAEEKARFENEDVYYEFDSATLLPVAQEILKKKAAYLKANPKIKVVIEGHCDERGTNEYNLALGDRRAKSALSFMANIGVESSRMSAISYGEERPVDSGHTEEAWAKNRRAHFVIE
ncbi:MAG: peptidoglycan-associated lipoprotein Pal [Thermodesulfobacteriota bacterium]